MDISDDLVFAGIKFGILPSLILSLIIMQFIKRKNPSISKKKWIIGYIVTFFVCVFLAITFTIFLFIVLMSGMLNDS